MGEHGGGEPNGRAAGGFTRREALRRGAILGGTTLWVAPMVQTVGMSRAFAQTGSPGPGPGPGPGTVECGRMTGGGSVLTTEYGRVTHGFQLYCADAVDPNTLQVNWRVGKTAYSFNLGSLTSRSCTDNPAFSATPPDADFDTFTGTGTGSVRVGTGPFQPGYTIVFTLTDAGEPGAQDWVKMTITDPGGTVVLATDGPIEYGNQQAHDATGSKQC